MAPPCALSQIASLSLAAVVRAHLAPRGLLLAGTGVATRPSGTVVTFAPPPPPSPPMLLAISEDTCAAEVPSVGHVVAGKYALTRPLGRGSMGEVWLAHHQTLGEDVAVKFLCPGPKGAELEAASKAAARFRFEAQIAARLSRKTRHIVRVTDHGEENGLAYLVMEVLEGATLEQSLLRTGSLSPSRTLELVTQIARALDQAHAEGVVHRDLKPSNVFLTRDEDGKLLVKLFDFGIASLTRAHPALHRFATGAGLVFGTPGYMSPEQASGSSKVDHRADLWALATIAYELMSGDLPVVGTATEELLRNVCAGRMVPLREKCPNLPLALESFFAQAFAEDLESRFGSGAELCQGLSAAIDAGELERVANVSRSRAEQTGANPSRAEQSVARDPMTARRRVSPPTAADEETTVRSRRMPGWRLSFRLTSVAAAAVGLLLTEGATSRGSARGLPQSAAVAERMPAPSDPIVQKPLAEEGQAQAVPSSVVDDGERSSVPAPQDVWPSAVRPQGPTVSGTLSRDVSAPRARSGANPLAHPSLPSSPVSASSASAAPNGSTVPTVASPKAQIDKSSIL